MKACLNNIIFSAFSVLLLLPARGQSLLDFSGQFSVWSHYNAGNAFPWWNGGRYIPQANISFPLEENYLMDFEASANIYGNLGVKNFSQTSANATLKPYRLWARFSSGQFELRGGLQKINFGSASILRPLMWFDRMDPRDPLQLTEGVWGLLVRYYFLNNTNIWFWTLYGNRNPKGWETMKTVRGKPEIGGRIQFPVTNGESAFSYHYRMADFLPEPESDRLPQKIPEHRLGFDTRIDWVIGSWVEASWKHTTLPAGMYTHQTVFNLGGDYTFNLRNGLTVVYEQLFLTAGEKAFRLSDQITFSLFTATYPIGIFDQLSFISYFDWKNHSSYNFLDWQKQFNRFTIHFMGYVNPKEYYIPTQQSTDMIFAGTGIQIMLIYNH